MGDTEPSAQGEGIVANPFRTPEETARLGKELYVPNIRSQVKADDGGQTIVIDSAAIPTVDLGGLVVYDTFAMRALAGNGVVLPQRQTNTVAHHAFGNHLSVEGLPFSEDVAETIGRAVWSLYVKSPPAPAVERSGYVYAVWRYILVPSALVAVAACLDYWSDRNLRGLHWTRVGGRVTNYGAAFPQVHAEEYVRSKQVLFEALGTNEGAKYANDLASAKPARWVKQLRKQDSMTAHTIDEMGLEHRGLLRPPLTVEGEGEMLTAWLIDKHYRHPSGPYRSHQLEPGFLDYGGACATTYALMLSLLYGDTTGRMAALLPPYESHTGILKLR